MGYTGENREGEGGEREKGAAEKGRKEREGEKSRRKVLKSSNIGKINLWCFFCTLSFV